MRTSAIELQDALWEIKTLTFLNIATNHFETLSDSVSNLKENLGMPQCHAPLCGPCMSLRVVLQQSYPVNSACRGVRVCRCMALWTTCAMRKTVIICNNVVALDRSVTGMYQSVT